MIHDDLIRHFENTPPAALSAEFSMNLRRRLRGAEPPRRRHALLVWAPRLYWVAAIAGLARYWRPAALTPLQLCVLAIVAATVVLTLRRTLGPGPLTRTRRASLWRQR